jgi:hypothetical protein
MKIKYLVMLFLTVSILLAQNKLNVTVNNKSPIIKIDSTALIAERNHYNEKLNNLLGKINVLEKEIADNKQSFFDSSLGIVSFGLGLFAILLTILGFIGFKSLDKKNEEYKSELKRIFDELKIETDNKISNQEKITSLQITDKINTELKNIDNQRKSFYDEAIDDLNKKYYELSSLLETIKIVYLSNTGKVLIPNVLSNDVEKRPNSDQDIFEEGENG